ncbi:MAG: carboxypeptidase regulatory-like domain-containing protein [Leptolyngbyaceae cyanobacterium RU_5_1]|nr:carboxypeptidase regulatory-like domain-containing protein [Leptolyngbyaceae cyanobacterium RU_5_1]
MGLAPVEGAIAHGSQKHPDLLLAHGVVINYQVTQAVQIRATYDNGESMANAQVTVYAPNGSDPWLKGKTDDKGRFIFTPDTDKSGNWEVKVRLAGHGDVISIPIESDQDGKQPKDGKQPIQAASAGDMTYSPLQKGVMAVSVIWGCIGTALFFQQRKG